MGRGDHRNRTRSPEVSRGGHTVKAEPRDHHNDGGRTRNRSPDNDDRRSKNYSSERHDRRRDRRDDEEERGSKRRTEVKAERRSRSLSPRRVEKVSSKTRSRSPSITIEKEKKKKSKKSKKKKTRSSSSDSSGSNQSKDDVKDAALQARLDAERERQKQIRKLQKQRMKERETPEEKRARRLAKKLLKEQKRKEELGWADECMGYSNVDNPFGDTNLTDTFVWNKKLEKQGLNVNEDRLKAEARAKIMANKEELEYFRKLREQREQAKEEREQEMRERDAAQFQEWGKQEDEFHLNQSRLRSKIRIKESRAKPIDLLARYIHAEEDEDDMDIEMHEPFHYLNGLTIRDLEDLLADIKVYRSLEGERNADYWDDVTVMAQLELDKLRKLDPSNTGDAYVGQQIDRRQGIHSSVQNDITDIFKGKSYPELSLLETEIRKKIASQQVGIDVGYWESLLQNLTAHMARARLKDRHQQTLKSKLAKLKREQLGDTMKKEVTLNEEGEEQPDLSTQFGGTVTIEEEQSKDWSKLTPEEREQQAIDLYEQRSYSPALQPEHAFADGATEIIDEEEDAQRLQISRKKYVQEGVTTSQKDAALEAEARKGMNKDEATFAVEAPVEHVEYLWSDKYRPRKPRYFNRVHTGFEWNKYNQTHYDLDNPPPKIVQGYRFNIFYPDLLDPNLTPEFHVLPCDDPDFAVIRFRAGPPYEDIAFKIVNREWEISNRNGYRCQFSNGIFQLWFHFKKYRYRR